MRHSVPPPEHSASSAVPVPAAIPSPAPTASLADLMRTFFYLGTTTFGGMWAATQKMEDILVTRKRWLAADELQALMVAATLIPAPKFLAFGGLVGFRLRGWSGSLLSLLALVMPGTLFVLICAIVLNPDVIGGALLPMREAVQMGVIGLLLGNAFHQLRGSKQRGRRQAIGVVLAIAVAVSGMLGIPLLVAAVGGIALGAWLLRNDQKAESIEQKNDREGDPQ